MKIQRCWQIQQLLQQPVNVRRFQQILGARDMGDFLERIIHRHRKMISRADVLAGQHHVAGKSGIDCNRSETKVVKRQWPRHRGGMG